MNNDKQLNYISDLVDIILSKLEEIEKEFLSSSETDKVYLKGQIFSYFDTLNIMRSQAEIFDITIARLEDEDLERFLTLS